MLPTDYRERVEKTLANRQANCISTAFYLSGLAESDMPAIDTWDAAYYILGLGLPLIDRFTEGCLAVWQSDSKLEESTEIVHMALITSENPRLITHRPGFGFLLRQNESSSAAEKAYEIRHLRVYVPLTEKKFPERLVRSLSFNV